MAVFAVRYTYAEDSEAARDVHRPAHREFLHSLDGLLASGPFADDPAGALLILDAPDAQSAATTFDADPFVTEGLVSAREIRQWTQVISPWV